MTIAAPHNVEAERTVVGALLLDPESMTKVAETLSAGDFFDPVYREIYEAMQRLHESRQPIDIITVGNALKDSPRVAAIGGTAFLGDCAQATLTASHIETYRDIVKENAIKRAYIETSRLILTRAQHQDVEIADLQSVAQQKLLALNRGASAQPFVPITQSTSEWHEAYSTVHGLSDAELNRRRVRTGFSSLDHYVSLRPGNVMIVAARTSMGKTAFALDVALNVAAQQKSVAFFSYEMTRHEILDRIVAGRLGVDTKTLENGKLTDILLVKVGRVLDELNQHQLFIDSNPDRSLSTFVSRARRLRMQHGLDLLVLDYLQLLYTTEKFAQQSRVQMVSHVSNTLGQLALELECPIIALAQLSRKPEDRPDKRPQLSDLRESGEIEQDAHQVLMLYREGYYNEDAANPGLTDVFIRKNRQGKTGSVQLCFNERQMTFTEIDRQHVDAPVASLP